MPNATTRKIVKTNLKNVYKNQERDGKGQFGPIKVKSQETISRSNFVDFQTAKSKLRSIRSKKHLAINEFYNVIFSLECCVENGGDCEFMIECKSLYGQTNSFNWKTKMHTFVLALECCILINNSYCRFRVHKHFLL